MNLWQQVDRSTDSKPELSPVCPSRISALALAGFFTHTDTRTHPSVAAAYSLRAVAISSSLIVYPRYAARIDRLLRLYSPL